MQFNPVETFRQEAEELLEEIEQSALSLGSADGSDEVVNRLFRAFHTIKGSGAMCGLDAVAAFTHHVESLLARAREGEIEVSPQLVDLVLKSKDQIKILLNAPDGVPDASSEELVSSLDKFGGGSGRTNPAPAAVAAPLAEAGKTWSIQFRPSPGMLACGGNPAALFRELGKLGNLEINAHTEQVPDLERIQPDQCYLWWTATLHTPADENAIRDVFIFVEDGSQLDVDKLHQEPADALAAEQKDTSSSEAKPEGAVAAPPATRQKVISKETTVRVPAERLDRLVNLVGELVMNQSRLAQAAAQNGAPEFTNPVQELERLVAELRDDVLGIRMLPIGTLFGRFQRLVRDLSAELGKEADLVTEGAETELDKSILDQLGEPLVHCLRNCLDHAVEPPDDRAKKGKPRRAKIRLSAVHTGSDVVVSIEDDGRGIDRDAVRAKAIERQLIAADADLSDRDIFNLILLPGFSTAKQVTNVSGRGVGMDAVKRQIDMLRGSLALASEAGKGTRISIRLPLTLAIIEGLLVEIGRDQFIVPMSAVTENVELVATQRKRNNGRNTINVRGDLVPYIDLRKTFSIDSPRPAIEKIVIIQHEEQRVGMVVDRVLGTHQTVIQSLGKFFRNIEVVSGATIMGDGRVSLILDTPAVVRHADRQCREEPLALVAG